MARTTTVARQQRPLPEVEYENEMVSSFGLSFEAGDRMSSRT
jgi:hypothetical protein